MKHIPNMKATGRCRKKSGIVRVAKLGSSSKFSLVLAALVVWWWERGVCCGGAAASGSGSAVPLIAG